MKHALVATSSYLLHVDLVSKEVVPVEASRTEYYGISWFEDDIGLTLSHSGLDNQTLTGIDTYALSEVGWISCGERESRRFLSQPHQILCAPDGRVVCANTGRNVVSALDLARPGLYHEAGVGPARWDRLAPDRQTGDHINSVFIKDEERVAIGGNGVLRIPASSLALREETIIGIRWLGATVRPVSPYDTLLYRRHHSPQGKMSTSGASSVGPTISASGLHFPLSHHW